MTLVYTDSTEDITPEMLKGFFQGWKNPPTPETHLRVLQNSAHIVLAVDADAGRVVGFITALTDGLQSAFIPLLEVLPEHQRHGIGTELVSRMLKKLEGIHDEDFVKSSDICHSKAI